MMLVPTFVAASPIHGVGIFIVNAAHRGQTLWEFTPGFDQSYTPAQFDRLPTPAKDYLHKYAFLDRSGIWIFSGDHDRYVNHSLTPSLAEDGKPHPVTMSLIATRDIAAGEELTQNYTEWDLAAREKGIL
jgi:hypothetical protein